eukprot:SM000195S05255  [mRNA]  locus=s195:10441:13888:+ [translate_table: standard]
MAIVANESTWQHIVQFHRVAASSVSDHVQDLQGALVATPMAIIEEDGPPGKAAKADDESPPPPPPPPAGLAHAAPLPPSQQPYPNAAAMGSMAPGMASQPMYAGAPVPPPQQYPPPHQQYGRPMMGPPPYGTPYYGAPPPRYGMPPPPHMQPRQMPPGHPSQPLFPIQGMRPPPHGGMLPRPPLFPVSVPPPQQQASNGPPTRTPLFPIQTPSPITGPSAQQQPGGTPAAAATQPADGAQPQGPAVLPQQASLSGLAAVGGAPPLHPSTPPSSAAPAPSHSYAAGPNTGGPSIGPPPVFNSMPAPAVAPLVIETKPAAAAAVHLVSSDENQSMRLC